MRYPAGVPIWTFLDISTSEVVIVAKFEQQFLQLLVTSSPCGRVILINTYSSTSGGATVINKSEILKNRQT